jgi:hypothetical protein
MMSRKKLILHLTVLVFFVLTVSFANFFHTEKGPVESDQCPACNLLKSTQATSQIHFFHLPSPTFLEILQIEESFDYLYIFVIHPSSRAPPQV